MELLQFECCFSTIFSLYPLNVYLASLTHSFSTFMLGYVWRRVNMFNSLKCGVKMKCFAYKAQILSVHIKIPMPRLSI